MKIRREFKIQLISVYLISTLIALIGTGIMLKIQWENSVEIAGDRATKDIDITSSTVKYILSNGSKLLDFTNRDLHQLIIENRYDHLAIKQAISNSASIFSIDSDVQSYGLLIVTDINGNLIGRSDGQPITDINFQDRYYFQAFKNNANKKFVIGPLLIARTTGKQIFHFAVPIKDKQDKFNGVLALQMDQESVVALFRKTPKEILVAVSDNNDIIFTTQKKNIHPNSNTAITFTDIFLNLNAALGENERWYQDKDMIVAHSYSPQLGINFFSMQPIVDIKAHFFTSNKNFIYLEIISQIIFTILMLFIYRQYLKSEQTKLVSTTDPLTHLPNRRAFDERYEIFLKESARNNSDICVLFIDIDKFKNCNDEYGHENGDLVLQNLAKILQSCLRRPFDFCCRWGGEELVVLLPDTDETGASNIAQKILDAVRNTPMAIIGHAPIHITVSIGIACGHNSAHVPIQNNLVDRADQAMYRAKQAGRDQFSF
jgi:diguanylate cyclase (GGDEF)-like protein